MSTVHFAEADDASKNAWQGEWETADGRYGISIRNCDSEEKCDVDTFGWEKIMGRNCLRKGRSQSTADSNTLNVDMTGLRNETSCALIFEKDDTHNPPEIRVKRRDNLACKIFTCAPVHTDEIRTYRLILKENFVGSALDADVCHGSLSKAARFWCTDKEMQSLAENLRHAPHVYFDLDSFWVDKAIAKCDSAVDVKGCLEDEYKDRIGQLKSESSKTAALYGPPGDVSEAKRLLKKMQGVYKKKFANSDISGYKYNSEDIFEFIPVSDFAAYFKVHLEFFNGHQCNIAGIGEYKKLGGLGGFVFQDPDSDYNYNCRLTIRLKGNAINFDDPNSNCLKFCGVRGGWNGDLFTLNQRQTIRYMPLILKSEEYQKALREYQLRHLHNQ